MITQKEQKLLDTIKQQGYNAELMSYKNDRIQVLYEDQILAYVKRADTHGYYLRVQDKENRIGETSFTDISDCEKSIQNALSTAKFQKSTPLSFESSSHIEDTRHNHNLVSQMEDIPIIDLGQTIVDGLKTIGSDIKGPLFLQKDFFDISLFTTEDAHRRFSKSLFSLEFEGKVSKEGNLLQINRFFTHSKDLPNIPEFIESIRDDYQKSQKNVKVASGNYDIILDPAIWEDLARPIEACFNGRSIEKNTSMLAGKEGQDVFDSRISIFDDPSIPFLENSVPFDDEGVICYPICLVYKGKMKDILLDKDSSAKMNISNNGRGFKRRALLGGRTFRTGVVPGITNLIVEAGNAEKKEIFETSKKSIYIKCLMGALLGHHLTGLVSGNIWLGYLVENGEVIGRIKDAQFNINIFQALKENIALVGKDLYTNKNFVSPFLLLKDIEITTK